MPPSESLRSSVSLWSLYGIWDYPLVRALITLLIALSDLLIDIASFMREAFPFALFTLSQPARSTKLSLPMVVLPDRLSVILTITVMIRCDRDEMSFIAVEFVYRSLIPRSKMLSSFLALLAS